jgi:dienelactone hydrolase
MTTCCPTDRPQVTSHYTPQQYPTYETGNYESKSVIITIPDIFGFSPQAKQFADVLGKMTNQRVIVLDPFQGKPWHHHHTFDGLSDWLKHYPYETIKPHVESLIKKLKFQGVENFYAIGFCWGGKITWNLAQDKIITKMGTAHPSFYDETFVNIPCPMAILPSKNEAPLLETKQALEASEYASQSVWERFDTMHHGWCAARADWDNEDNKKETMRALEIFAKFFKD